MVICDASLEQFAIQTWHFSVRKSKDLSRLEGPNPILPTVTQYLEFLQTLHLTVVRPGKEDGLPVAIMLPEDEEKGTAASHCAASVSAAQKTITCFLRVRTLMQ